MIKSVNGKTVQLTDLEIAEIDAKDKKWIEQSYDRKIALLRTERNQLLLETDWRMVSDYPGTNQAEWQTYRQALRDITIQTMSLDKDGNLTGVIWPTPPTD